jgi:hypothetical protein
MTERREVTPNRAKMKTVVMDKHIEADKLQLPGCPHYCDAIALLCRPRVPRRTTCLYSTLASQLAGITPPCPGERMHRLSRPR